jgi:hypothetical protein
LNFFTEHYTGISVLAEIAMTAIVVLPLAIPAAFKVFLLTAAALAFGWMNRESKGELPICGADINADGIARPPQDDAK